MSTSGSPTWSSGTFAYDGAGNIKSLSSGIVSDLFRYDRVDRLVKAKLDRSIFSGYYREYAYDIHGNRIEIDRNGQVETVAVQSGRNRLTDGLYDASGNLENYDGAFTFSWDGNYLDLIQDELRRGIEERSHRLRVQIQDLRS